MEEVQSNNFLKRGARLKETDVVCMIDFCQKARFIKEDISIQPQQCRMAVLSCVHECRTSRRMYIKECRAVAGDRFGICSFAIKEAYKIKKLVI